MSVNDNNNDFVLQGDDISKEKLCVITKTHKRKMQYLIENNILTCEITGNRTRCYNIKVDDAIDFMNNKEKYFNKIPVGGLSSIKPSNPKKYYVVVESFTEREKMVIVNYFSNLLLKYSDLMSTHDVVEVTGLSIKTILKWIEKNKIRTLKKKNKNYIPKKAFIEFVTSEDFYKINTSSQKYEKLLRNVFKKINKRVYSSLESCENNNRNGGNNYV